MSSLTDFVWWRCRNRSRRGPQKSASTIDVNGESTRVTINRATLMPAGLTDGTITDESDLAASLFTPPPSKAARSQRQGSATAGAAAGEGVTLALASTMRARPLVFDDATDDADTYTLSVSNIRSSSNGNFLRRHGARHHLGRRT